MTAVRRLLRRLHDDRGFTLIELMVAAMVAAVGVGAVTTVLMGSRELVTDSERGNAAAHVAEREMEKSLAVAYNSLALKQAPGTSADPKDPRFYVSANGSNWTYKWNQTSTGAAATSRVLVDAAAGGLDASTPWNDGRMSGVVYRFVTVYDDPTVANVPTAVPPLLPDGEGKRVTVVVTVTGGTRARKPVLVDSVVLP